MLNTKLQLLTIVSSATPDAIQVRNTKVVGYDMKLVIDLNIAQKFYIIMMGWVAQCVPPSKL